MPSAAYLWQFRHTIDEEGELLLKALHHLFPLPPQYHGTETVAIKVGIPPQDQNFVIHKNLLTAALPWAVAMQGTYYEDTQQPLLTLAEHHVRAFEVFYQYLYTGRIYAYRHYSLGPNSSEGYLWLKVYALGSGVQMPAMRQVAFRNLRGMFNPKQCKVPNMDMIHELNDDRYPECLRMYMALHAVWWMTQNTASLALWSPLIQMDARFGRQVALLLARVGFEGKPSHPWMMLRT